MTAKILDGKRTAAAIKTELQRRLDEALHGTEGMETPTKLRDALDVGSQLEGIIGATNDLRGQLPDRGDH